MEFKNKKLKAELTGESQLVEHLPWPVPKITKKGILKVFGKKKKNMRNHSIFHLPKITHKI